MGLAKIRARNICRRISEIFTGSINDRVAKSGDSCYLFVGRGKHTSLAHYVHWNIFDARQIPEGLQVFESKASDSTRDLREWSGKEVDFTDTMQQLSVYNLSIQFKDSPNLLFDCPSKLMCARNTEDNQCLLVEFIDVPVPAIQETKGENSSYDDDSEEDDNIGGGHRTCIIMATKVQWQEFRSRMLSRHDEMWYPWAPVLLLKNKDAVQANFEYETFETIFNDALDKMQGPDLKQSPVLHANFQVHCTDWEMKRNSAIEWMVRSFAARYWGSPYFLIRFRRVLERRNHGKWDSEFIFVSLFDWKLVCRIAKLNASQSQEKGMLELTVERHPSPNDEESIAKAIEDGFIMLSEWEVDTRLRKKIQVTRENRGRADFLSRMLQKRRQVQSKEHEHDRMSMDALKREAEAIAASRGEHNLQSMPEEIMQAIQHHVRKTDAQLSVCARCGKAVLSVK